MKTKDHIGADTIELNKFSKSKVTSSTSSETSSSISSSSSNGNGVINSSSTSLYSAAFNISNEESVRQDALLVNNLPQVNGHQAVVDSNRARGNKFRKKSNRQHKFSASSSLLNANATNSGTYNPLSVCGFCQRVGHELNDCISFRHYANRMQVALNGAKQNNNEMNISYNSNYPSSVKSSNNINSSLFNSNNNNRSL